MSRPFSYNDENFTVINNLLILHAKIIRDISMDESFVEVPPEIFNRMDYYTYVAISVLDKINVRTTSTVTIGVKEVDGRKYFYSSKPLSKATTSSIIALFMLKDI